MTATSVAYRLAETRAWWKQCAAPGLDLLATLGGPRADDPRAQVLLLTIAMQESGLRHRAQQLGGGRPGPARGWWQFEAGGGVSGVLNHLVSATLSERLCERLRIPASTMDAWRCLEGSDLLAVGFARLLLWTDPKPLPALSDRDGAWDYYLRNWRPGKPHPETWKGHWAMASAAIDTMED